MGHQLLPRAQKLLQEADAIKSMGRRMASGITGTVRVGLGSGPGAILSISMLMHMARHHPDLHLEVARGGTELLIHALRQRRLDAAVVDIRAMRPASDLQVSLQIEMPASFLCRSGHPLCAWPGPVPFQQVLAYPIASTPLSDEVARILTERYGPRANPDDMVTVRSDETSHIAELARDTDTVVLSILAAAPDLLPLVVQPALDATARFGLVTLAQREPAPALRIVREQLPGWIAEVSG
jgi:DNA-binding transcriptional LysR family regulator